MTLVSLIIYKVPEPTSLQEQEMCEKHKCLPGAKFKRVVYIQ